jgi:hypothetical protein
MYKSLANIGPSCPAGGQAIFSSSRGMIVFFIVSAKVASRWQFSDWQYFDVTQHRTT